MKAMQRGLVGALALAGLTTISQEAAAQPVPEGTLIVAAERLVASNLIFDGPTTGWENQILGAPGSVPFSTPRFGIDYFVINGLSLGGHLGHAFHEPEGPDNGYVYIAVMPRIGYAFSLSQTFDFWPRGGVGFIGGNRWQDETAVITLEAMFLANINQYFAIEFGPAVEVFTADWAPDVITGGNAGIAVSF